MFSSFVSDSGATYSSLVLPDSTSFLTSSMAERDSEELMKWAMPSSSLNERMASTWFFIKAMRGEMTTATPSIRSEGSW